MPPILVWRCSHSAVSGAVPYLQMGDVAVDVHGRCLAVLRDVLVVLRARLPIHTIDTGDGYILIASGYIPTEGADKVKVGARIVLRGGFPDLRALALLSQHMQGDVLENKQRHHGEQSRLRNRYVPSSDWVISVSW